MTNTKQIFVVGNSRSGTTMMGRILGNHPDIFTFKELHFFGQLWCSNETNNRLNRKEYVLNAEELTKFFKHQNIKDYAVSKLPSKKETFFEALFIAFLAVVFIVSLTKIIMKWV